MERKEILWLSACAGSNPVPHILLRRKMNEQENNKVVETLEKFEKNLVEKLDEIKEELQDINTSILSLEDALLEDSDDKDSEDDSDEGNDEIDEEEEETDSDDEKDVIII